MSKTVKSFFLQEFAVPRWWFYLIAGMLALENLLLAIVFLTSFEVSAWTRKAK